MLNPIKPFVFYDKDDGSGQDGGGSEESQTADGQKDITEENGQDISKLAEKLDNMYKTMTKWSSEIGEIRKSDEALNLLTQKFEAIEDKLLSNENDEDGYDPYNKEQVVGMIQEAIKPLQEQKFLTEDAFKEQLANMLSAASENATVKQEFGLKDEELTELVNSSTETGQPVKLLAYEKYAERKFKNKEYLEKLSEELKNNDTTPPPESASETVFDKTGIPSDPIEFEKWYKEKESAKQGSAKQALMEAESKASG